MHIGFNAIFKSMLPDIQAFMVQNSTALMVHCIGHSLGGAVATLAADWVSQSLKTCEIIHFWRAARRRLSLLQSA